MADLPPDVAAQVIKLNAFVKDIELSVRTAAKGSRVQPVGLDELRAWVHASLEHDDDAPQKLSGSVGEGMPYLTPAVRTQVLKSLKTSVLDRVKVLESLKAGEDDAPEPFAIKTLVGLAQDKASVAAKSGVVTKATKEDVKKWLGAPATKD